VTSIETSAIGVTVNSVDPVIPEPESLATIVELPSAMLVAAPSNPAALLIVATPGAELSHVTAVVRSWVELSV